MAIKPAIKLEDCGFRALGSDLEQDAARRVTITYVGPSVDDPKILRSHEQKLLVFGKVK